MVQAAAAKHKVLSSCLRSFAILALEYGETAEFAEPDAGLRKEKQFSSNCISTTG
jgi:hypothetical protein